MSSPCIPLALGVSVGDPAGVALLPPVVEGQLVVGLVVGAAAPAAGREAAQEAAESLSPLECVTDALVYSVALS